MSMGEKEYADLPNGAFIARRGQNWCIGNFLDGVENDYIELTSNEIVKMYYGLGHLLCQDGQFGVAHMSEQLRKVEEIDLLRQRNRSIQDELDYKSELLRARTDAYEQAKAEWQALRTKVAGEMLALADELDRGCVG